MKTIEYRQDGGPIPDASCSAQARSFLSLEGDLHMTVSTENFINEVRALVAEGFIPNTEVQFLFEGKGLVIDQDGRLADWPLGFCDHTDNCLTRLLSANSEARKKQ